ncbi:MAG TPA: hypothetical protein VEO02_06410 [Thermoanaerobaculia bacterium]|nr:hypothetical protein [Thermoanaerobaculia bacterium]
MKGRGRFSILKGKSRRGFRGYPLATIAYYGPDATRATKVAVGIIAGEHQEASPLERWHSLDLDVRFDQEICGSIVEFLQAHHVRSVVMSPGIIGCPHQEGVDYPEGEKCPACPYWADKDRWTGEVIQ